MRVFLTSLFSLCVVLPRPGYCVANGDLRLAGYGSSSLAGRLEMLLGGEWGSLCGEAFDYHAARVACRQLGVGYAVAYLTTPDSRYGVSNGPVHLEPSAKICHGNESHLLRCEYRGLDSWSNCSDHQQDVSLACSSVFSPYRGSVRLAGGDSPSNGGLQVFSDGWASVCSDGFTDFDALSVCYQLGYTTLDHYTRNHDDPGPFWAVSDSCTVAQPCYSRHCLTQLPDTVETSCPTSASVYINCSFNTTFQNDTPQGSTNLCTLNRTSPRDGDIRLVGSTGRVEVYFDTTWGTFCNNPTDFGIPEAEVVCRQAGYPAVLHINTDTATGGGGNMYALECDGFETEVRRCPRLSTVDPLTGGCSHTHNIAVECSEVLVPYGSVMLDGGSGASGRLLVHATHSWEPVCDTNFGISDAHVACRQLGYALALAVHGNSYYNEVTPYSKLYRHRGCTGAERHLLNCSGTTPSASLCRPGLDEVGVVCTQEISPESGRVRLANGSDAQEGRLEVNIAGVWGSVCGGAAFGMLEAHVACKQLGFKKADSLNARNYGGVAGPVLLRSVRCWGFEEQLLHCLHSAVEGSTSCTSPPVSLRCSDSLSTPDGTLFLANRTTATATGTNTTSGRLEVSLYDTRAAVCGHGGLFTEGMAQVACRQLGFEFKVDYCTDSCHGSGRDLSLLLEARCSGSESSLSVCALYGLRCPSACNHTQDVGLTCGTSVASTEAPTETTTITPPPSFLPIPAIYVYLIVAAAGAALLLTLSVLVALCCVCACKRKKNKSNRTWQASPASSSGGGRVQSAGVSTTAHPRLLSAETSGALSAKMMESDGKVSAEGDFDDPTKTVEAESSFRGDAVGGASAKDSIPPFAPPSYDELDFLPGASGHHGTTKNT